MELALARPVHPDHLYERSVFTQVPDAARNARSTPRLASLSEPKAHTMWVNNRDLLQEREFCQPITPICNSALKGRCTPRVENLAESKMTNPDYLGERTVRWPVTDSARNATATLRLQQLSRPKSARLKKDDYDPYRVTLSALKARPAPRLCELSLPIPRKIRPKKNWNVVLMKSTSKHQISWYSNTIVLHLEGQDTYSDFFQGNLYNFSSADQIWLRH